MPAPIGHPSRQGAAGAARSALASLRRSLRVGAAAMWSALVCAAGAGGAAAAAPAGTSPPVSTAAAPAVSAADAAAGCKGTVYLTLDTGNMSQAQTIADILARHGVKATFFLANERTARGDSALDDGWSGYWRARVAEGHAFGSHTYDHVYLRDARAAGRAGARDGARDAPGDSAGAPPVFLARPQFGANAGRSLTWDGAALCSELRRVDARLRELAGRGLDPLWRAPGGRAPAAAMQAGSDCGFRHVHWAPAGFLGDELPSETHPNDRLLEQALARVRDGDVLMAHLGIWSRREPFAPMLDPLIAGLKRRGLCFATLGAPAARGRP